MWGLSTGYKVRTSHPWLSKGEKHNFYICENVFFFFYLCELARDQTCTALSFSIFQGHYSLQDLELIAGDVLCFEYDFGSPSMFHVKIEKVTGGKDGNETDLLPEVNIAGHSTHVKLVKKEYKAPKQY